MPGTADVSGNSCELLTLAVATPGEQREIQKFLPFIGSALTSASETVERSGCERLRSPAPARSR
jgi:hypothetical protein